MFEQKTLRRFKVSTILAGNPIERSPSALDLGDNIHGTFH